MPVNSSGQFFLTFVWHASLQGGFICSWLHSGFSAHCGLGWGRYAGGLWVLPPPYSLASSTCIGTRSTVLRTEYSVHTYIVLCPPLCSATTPYLLRQLGAAAWQSKKKKPSNHTVDAALPNRSDAYSADYNCWSSLGTPHSVLYTEDAQ